MSESSMIVKQVKDFEKKVLKHSDRRESMYNELAKKSILLTELYKGGIHVLLDENNPDKFSHSANSFREFIEKFPEEYAGINIDEQYKVIEKVNNINNIWKKSFLSKNYGMIDANTIVEYDDKTFDFLNECRSLFIEYNRRYKSRNQQFREAYLSLDKIYPDLEFDNKVLTKSISSLRRYFNNVVHHEKFEEVEFYLKLFELEKLFIDLIVPQTMSDLSSIDNIIAEGEKDD